MQNVVYQITLTHMLKAREGFRDVDVAIDGPVLLPGVFASKEELDTALSKYRDKAEKDKNNTNYGDYCSYDFIEKDISSMTIEGEYIVDEVEGGFGETYYYPVVGDFCLNNLSSLYCGKKVRITVELID